MTTFLPIYALTLYLPATGSADNENTPLIPDANSPHSDAFKVATANVSVNGDNTFKPYLNAPQGRKGTLDIINGITTFGNLTMKIQDQRLGAGNFERWVTGFISVIQVGLRAVVLESTDNGITFNPFFVGRISDYTLSDLVNYTITIKEESRALDWLCFVGRPCISASNAMQQSLLPIGMNGQYGDYPMSTSSFHAPFSGTIASVQTSINTSNFFAVNLLPSEISTIYNVVTDGVKALLASTTKTYTVQVNSPTTTSPYGQEQWVAVNVYNINSGSNDYTLLLRSASNQAEYAINSFIPASGWSNTKIGGVIFSAITGSTNPVYKPLSTFPVGSPVMMRVIPNRLAVSDKNPVFVSNTPVPQFMSDVLTGYYSYLDPSTGMPLKQLNVDTTAFNKLINDPQVPRGRWKFSSPTSMKDVLQKYIAPFGYGYRIEPTGSNGYYFAKFVPFSNIIPTSSANLATITDADINDTSKTAWQIGLPISTITLKYYLEQPTQLSAIKGSTNFNHWLVDEAENTVVDLNLMNANDVTTGQQFQIDALGVRDESNPLYFLLPGYVPYANHLYNLMLNYYTTRFGTTAAKITLDCERNTNTNDIKVGDFVIVQTQLLPDSTINERNGSRLVQVIERWENGPHVTFKFQDCGQNVMAPKPSIGKLNVDGSGNITIPITDQIGSRIRVDVAMENIGASQPAANSSDWLTWGYYDLIPIPFVTGTYFNPQEGRRYYIRAQAQFTQSANKQPLVSMPSLFASASPAFIDIAAITAPSMSAATVAAGGIVTASWTNNGDNISRTIVNLAFPTGTTAVNVGVMMPGTTQFILTNMPAGTGQVSVTHAGSNGGQSLPSSMTFTVTSTNATQNQTSPPLNAYIITTPTFTNPSPLIPRITSGGGSIGARTLSTLLRL